MIQHHVNYNMCGASVHDAAHDTSVISKQNLLLEFCADPKSRDEMQAYIDVSRQAQKQEPEIYYRSFQITKKQGIGSHLPLSCFFFIPNYIHIIYPYIQFTLKNTPGIALWLSYFLTTKAVF